MRLTPAFVLAAFILGCEPTEDKKTAAEAPKDYRIAAQSLLDTGMLFASEPALAATVDGGYVVAWDRRVTSSGSSELALTEFSADGKPGTSRTIPRGSYSGYGAPSIAALPTGGYVMSWSAFGQERYDRRLLALAPGWDSPRVMNDTFSSGLLGVSVVGLRDGGFVLAYLGADSLAPNLPIVRRFDAQGNRVGADFRKYPPASGGTNFGDPELANLPDGGWMAFWLEEDTSVTLHGQAFTSSGVKRGEENHWKGECWDAEMPQPKASPTLDGGIFLSNDLGSGTDCAMLLDGDGRFVKYAVAPPWSGKMTIDPERGRMWGVHKQNFVLLDEDAKMAATYPIPDSSFFFPVFAATKAGRIAFAYTKGDDHLPTRDDIKVILVEPL